jgi:alpha-tubulin suppressor-like RCC1 family protein
MGAAKRFLVLANLIAMLALILAVPVGAASPDAGLWVGVNRAAPANTAAAITPPAMTVVGGGTHTCALTLEGGVVCWGANTNGQLGNGSTAEGEHTPLVVHGLRSGVIGLSVEWGSTCALTNMGKVYCWGTIRGDLNGTTAYTPTEMNGLGSQVVQIAGPCALTAAGKVMCWGGNGLGQLGNGTYVDSATPVTAIASGALQITSGNFGSTNCAVMQTGEVMCWGWGDYGQLGDGKSGNHNSNVPAKVVLQNGAPLTGATQVRLGTVFGCALTGDNGTGGGVMCWGNNRFGQLGNGQIVNTIRTFAAPVLNSAGGSALSGVKQISAGEAFLCARLTTGNVKCWGQGGNGQLGVNSTTNTGVPVTVLDTSGSAALSGVTEITTGMFHNCAFTSWEAQNPLYCWGHNGMGQGGTGDLSNATLTLPQPVLDFSRLPVGGDLVSAAIISGGAHTCSFTSADGLKCWGSNTHGQLGSGTLTSSSDVPVDVAGLSSGVKSVALGQNFSCAILAWGKVKCWGENTHGQLATGDKLDSAQPVAAILPDVMVTQVAAGNGHACALTSGGSVRCWGDNTAGQLGDGTTNESATPVIAIASGAVWIAAGGSTSCAVLDSGAVKCWGLGESGQLGDNASGAGHHQTLPASVLVAEGSPLATATQVAAGADFACALLANGQVDCWGKNSLGQLGRGSASPLAATASAVVTDGAGTLPLDRVHHITAGGAHACALMFTNRLKCWGQGESGQIGDGSSGAGVFTALPHPVLDHYANPPVYLEGVIQVSAGGAHTCAFLNWSDPLPYRCWGSNSDGQLGDGDASTPMQKNLLSGIDKPYPNPVQDLLTFSSPPLDKVTAGVGFSCALTRAGGVKCWGDNYYGQLGDGTNTSSTTPVSVVGLDSGVVGLSAASRNACALTAAGGVVCWGTYLPTNTAITIPGSNSPVAIAGLSSGVIDLAAGADHACALMAGGGVKCWGYDNNGQLGNGNNKESMTPVDVYGLDSGVIGLSSGDYYTCALTSVGGVKCWGDNYYGQIGDGTTINRYIPVDVLGLASGVIQLSVSGWHACILTSSGGVKCWGFYTYAVIDDHPTDVVGVTSEVVGLYSGGFHSCALMAGGGIKCWGKNDYGQLGNGSKTNSFTAVDVINLPPGVTAVGGGGFHTCAVLAGSAPLRCWGDNNSGQYGDGTTTSSTSPVDSKWLTADGLVEDNKTEVILPTVPNTTIVLPAQPVETPVTVTVTEDDNPPALCSGCVALQDGAIVLDDWDRKGEVHAWFYFDFTEQAVYSAARGMAADFNPSTINLYQYVAGAWAPILPCTGCSIDPVTHILKAPLNGDGIYLVMEHPMRKLYLPVVIR